MAEARARALFSSRSAAHVVQFLLKGQPLFNRFAVGEDGRVNKQVGQFFAESEPVFLLQLHVVNQVGVHEHGLAGGINEGVGLPAPGQFVEGDDCQAEGFLHEPFNVDATAPHALRPFGESGGGDSFQFKEPEFPNLWAFSCIGHF